MELVVDNLALRHRTPANGSSTANVSRNWCGWAVSSPAASKTGESRFRHVSATLDFREVPLQRNSRSLAAGALVDTVLERDFSPIYNYAMSIEKSGKWWVGTSPNDIKEYLEACSAEGYGSQAFRQTKCTCGGENFELLADDDEGCAKRILGCFAGWKVAYSPSTQLLQEV